MKKSKLMFFLAVLFISAIVVIDISQITIYDFLPIIHLQ